MIRAFVALPIPPTALEAIEDPVPPEYLVAPDDLHLTLAFLDSQPEGWLRELDVLLSQIHAPAFDLQLAGVGDFHGRQLHARTRPEPLLLRLQARVVQAVADAGLVLRHRRFVPHVTLARLPLGAEALAGAWAATHGDFVGPVLPIHEFALYASHLGRHGARYEVLATYPLRPA